MSIVEPTLLYSKYGTVRRVQYGTEPSRTAWRTLEYDMYVVRLHLVTLQMNYTSNFYHFQSSAGHSATALSNVVDQGVEELLRDDLEGLPGGIIGTGTDVSAVTTSRA